MRIATALMGVQLLSMLSLAAQTAPPREIPALHWQPVAAGVAIVGITMFFDGQIARAVNEHATPASIRTAHTLNRFGEITVIAPVAGGLAVAGLLAGRPALLRTAERIAASAVLASALSQATKYSLGRSRPYQDADLGADDFAPFSGRVSFPSGHATAAFAFATTLGDATGNTVARVGLYTLATGVAWARIAESDHWLSDVIAGAGLGIVAGKFASGRIRIFGLHAPQFLIGPHGNGLSWNVELPPIK
ncbi:MAG: phosphatase PAP2 family protein [Gemmatimonadota bacterium]